MDPVLRQMVQVAGEDEVEGIIWLREGATPPPGVRIVSRFGEVATCRLPRDRIRQIWADDAVRSLKGRRHFGVDPEPLEGEEAPEFLPLRASDARRPRELEYTGAGTVVAILDWGIDFAHDNFRRADGSTRLRAIWDQSDRNGPAPEPYGYGRVYSRDEIDRALRSDAPYDALGYHPAKADRAARGAHGTHVADIAAGNGRASGSPVGIAPDAEFLFVHLSTRGTGERANLGDSVTLLEAIAWVGRMAGDEPLVINASVGKHGGPHTGQTHVERGIDYFLNERPGRFMAQSAGNYFRGDAHASGLLRPGQHHTFEWIVDRADVTPNELEVWYAGVDTFRVEISPPDSDAVFSAVLGEDTKLIVDGAAVGELFHRAREPVTGSNHVDVFLERDAPPGRWSLRLSAEDVVDGRFHIWVERDRGGPRNQSRLDPGDVDRRTTTGTICNGFYSVAVGAYDQHEGERPVAPFSSSGPTADGRIKPDLAGPGYRVLAARSARPARGDRSHCWCATPERAWPHRTSPGPSP